MKKFLFLGLFSLSLTFSQGQTAYLFQQNYSASGQLTAQDTIPLVGLSNPAFPSPMPIDEGGAEFTLTYRNGPNGSDLLTPPATPAYVDPQIYCNIATQAIAGDLIDSFRTRADIGYIVGFDMVGCAATYGEKGPTGATLESVRDAVRQQYPGLNATGTDYSSSSYHRLLNYPLNGGAPIPFSPSTPPVVPDQFAPLPNNSGVGNYPESLKSGQSTQPAYVAQSPANVFNFSNLPLGATGSGWILNNIPGATPYLTPTRFSGAAGYSENWAIFDQNGNRKAGPSSPVNIFPESYITATYSKGVPLTAALPYNGIWPELTITINGCYPSSRYVVVVNQNPVTTPNFSPYVAQTDTAVPSTISNGTNLTGANADYYVSTSGASSQSYTATFNFNTYNLFATSGTYTLEVWEAVPINLTRSGNSFVQPVSSGSTLPAYVSKALTTESPALASLNPVGGALGPITGGQVWWWHVVPTGNGAGSFSSGTTKSQVTKSIGAVGDVVTP